MFRFSALRLCALMVLVVPASASAAPTDLDPSFGSSGVTTTPITQGPNELASVIRDVVSQPDGKLLFVGGRYNSGSWQWVIGRYSENGALDTTFNSGFGYESWPSAPQSLSFADAGGGQPGGGATTVTFDGTGLIDVSGQTTGSNAPVEVLQLTSSGGISSYGANGIASIPVGNSSATTVHAIARQPDGKLVVAGEAFVSGNSTPFVARFNTDGTPDTSFAPGGLYEIPANACDDTLENCSEGGLALATNGASVDAIYIGGSDMANLVGGRVWKLVPGVGGFAVDTTYGTNGGAQIERHAVNEVDALILQGGNVIVAGYAENAQNSKSCGIARVGSTGGQDTSFGAHIDVGGTCTVRDLAADSSGRYVFTGESFSGTQSNGTESLAVGRWTAVGQPDPAFAAGGGAALSPGGSPAFGEAILMQGDKPVVAGGAGSPTHDLMAARLLGGELAASGGGGGPGGAGGSTNAPFKPINTTLPSAPAAGDAPLKLAKVLTCAPGVWLPSGYTITGYHWLRIPFSATKSPLSLAPTVVAATQSYKVAPADQGQQLACTATATNSAGSTTVQSPLYSVLRRIKIPNVRGMTVARAQARLRVLFGGQVSFGTKREQQKAGASIDAIPCEFGGNNAAYGKCDTPKAGTIDPGQVFNATPPIGHYLDEAYGSGKLPKIVIDYYEPARDRSDDVPPATPKVDCPATDGKSVNGDFENRIQGHYIQYARDLLAQYHCPFTETTRYTIDQTVDTYVSEVQTARVKGDLGYALTVAAPKVPELAAAAFHRRLNGRDSYQGANLSRGPVDPGLGTDGRLTVTKGGQKNDICFTVTETSTTRPVPQAVIHAYAPDGTEVHDLLGRKDQATTGPDGVACATFSIDQPGWYKFVYTYYGSNGSNEEGYQQIEAIDRGHAVWMTMDGRQMQCQGECSQLGFASSRRAHAANVLGDIGAAIGSFLNSLLHGGSPHINQAGVQQAIASDGSPSATLYTAQADNGVTPSVLVLKGKLQPGGLTAAPIVSTSGSGLISNDGGSLVGVRLDSLISNDGGSLIAQLLGGANGVSALKGVKVLLVTKDGRIISNDGASLISNDGGSVVSNPAGRLLSENGLGVVAQPSGAVVMIGGRAVIANASGELAPGTLVSLAGNGAMPAGHILSTYGGG